MMYDYFKALLEVAEEIGKADKAELGKYRLSLRLEEPKDGND